MALLPLRAQAERIEPPLELLHDPATLVVAGDVEEVNPATNRIVFARKELLAGQTSLLTQDEIEVLVPADALARIAVGKRYVFAYTLFAPDPRRPGKLAVKRQGATLLVAPGVEPGLFEDTRALRDLLRLSGGREPEGNGKLRALLLQALSDKDAALRNLAANEFALAPELRRRLGGREREAIRQFVRDPAAPAFGRIALLEAAARDPKVYGERWALDTAAELLSATSADGVVVETPDREALLRSALLLFDQTPTVALPPETLQRWLRSNSIALVEPALRLLQRQSPETARAAILQAAQDNGTPAQTRAFLHEYLKRIDAAHARRDAGGNARQVAP